MPAVDRNGHINKIAPQLLSMAVPIDSLTPDSDNAREHPETNMEAVRASLSKYGQVHPLLCRESTRIIIAGNGRWQAAKDLGWTKIAAHFISVNEVDAAGLGLIDNRSAELAKWNMDTVARIQRLQASIGEASLGWDDDYIYTISELEDWNPQPQDINGAQDESSRQSVTLKLTAAQNKLLQDCLNCIKQRTSSPKKMLDGLALEVILREWLRA